MLRLTAPQRAVCTLLMAAVAGSAAAESPLVWPQWRGPTRDGVASGPAWPDAIGGDALTELWRVELGPGYSGPIVAEDRVFVVETRDRQEEVVRALDRATGEQLWQASWNGALSVPFFAKANGDWIRATPAYDGESLFVAGMRDVLVCLNAADGAERWRVDFVERHETELPSFGFVSSPLVDGESIYLQAAGSVLKLDKRSGETTWRALEDGGGMMGSAFSSPVLCDLAGRRQLVVQTRTLLAGLDPESGRVLWQQEVPSFRGMNILTPTIVGDGVLTSAYGGRTAMYKVAAAGEGFQVTEAWTEKSQAYMSSPVVVDGRVYMHLRNERVTCLEAAGGEQLWTSEPFGSYWSMVTQGERILALDASGDLFLLRANPDEFELLDTRHVSDSTTWAHLAVCGEEVFIRALDAIAAYRWRPPNPGAAAAP